MMARKAWVSKHTYKLLNQCSTCDGYEILPGQTSEGTLDEIGNIVSDLMALLMSGETLTTEQLELLQHGTNDTTVVICDCDTPEEPSEITGVLNWPNVNQLKAILILY